MTEIIGILNVTPDSFSDGGRYEDLEAAVEHALAMVAAGASFIDVGGESTRPGAERIDADLEKSRVLPVIEQLVAHGVKVSIDTMNAATAAAAAEAGASMINDVSGGLADRGMRRVMAETGLDCVIMHWRGASAKMQEYANYGDVVRTVREELKQRIAELIVVGVDPAKIILDPGLGFAKTAQHNWQLLSRINELATLGHRILIGTSRKSFFGELLPDTAPATDRDFVTAVTSALATQAGVWGVRVHDVAASKLAIEVGTAWLSGRSTNAIEPLRAVGEATK